MMPKYETDLISKRFMYSICLTGVHKSLRHATRANKFCTVTPNICVLSMELEFWGGS
jgi:hypothetical protein